MPYITSVERIGMEKGQVLGRREGVYSSLRAQIQNAKLKGIADEMIAEVTGLDIPSVNKVWNNESIDLPPHLLTLVDVPGTVSEMR